MYRSKCAYSEYWDEKISSIINEWICNSIKLNVWMWRDKLLLYLDIHRIDAFYNVMWTFLCINLNDIWKYGSMHSVCEGWNSFQWGIHAHLQMKCKHGIRKHSHWSESWKVPKCLGNLKKWSNEYHSFLWWLKTWPLNLSVANANYLDVEPHQHSIYTRSFRLTFIDDAKFVGRAVLLCLIHSFLR